MAEKKVTTQGSSEKNKDEMKALDEKKEVLKKAVKKQPSEVRAKLRFLRMSPRKVRVVTNAVKNMAVNDAIDYLKFVNKVAKMPILKLIQSAAANGENNFEMQKDKLVIKSLVVNDGPTLKRFKPRAHGRAAPIRKRTSHVEVILAETAKGGIRSTKKKVIKQQDVEIVKADTVKKNIDVRKDSSRSGSSKKGLSESNAPKKYFSRKTG
jgi:large subunit ribosomal protein L22